jgi:16S rRNA (guanine527-N7)-methyltransferase
MTLNPHENPPTRRDAEAPAPQATPAEPSHAPRPNAVVLDAAAINGQALAKHAQSLGLTLSPEALAGLITYSQLLFDTNITMNLVRLHTVDDWVNRHLLDALALATQLPENAKVLDIGAGGGVPGVPLALVRPDIRVTALDATAKKCRFLESLIAPLGLEGRYQVRTGRAEDWGQQDDMRAQFDVVTARAVAALHTLLEWSVPFLKVNGCLLAMKGQKADQELADAQLALTALHAKHQQTLRFTHPALAESAVLVIQKCQPTPELYPRPAAKAAKAPLLPRLVRTPSPQGVAP